MADIILPTNSYQEWKMWLNWQSSKYVMNFGRKVKVQ